METRNDTKTYQNSDLTMNKNEEQRNQWLRTSRSDSDMWKTAQVCQGTRKPVAAAQEILVWSSVSSDDFDIYIYCIYIYYIYIDDMLQKRRQLHDVEM